jgi:hypothetical protein
MSSNRKEAMQNAFTPDAFTVTIHEEKTGYVLKWGGRSYISGPHPSLQYAERMAARIQYQEDNPSNA